jgi:hypothetical protein
VEASILGAEGKNAEFDGPLDELFGDLAGERSLDGDPKMRIIATEVVQDGKQPQARIFVGRDGETATLEGAKLFEGSDGFAAQAEEALGIVAQQFAGGGEGPVARGAFEEGLADLVFEFANGMADGGLSPAHTNGGSGKAFFFDDGEEGL